MKKMGWLAFCLLFSTFGFSQGVLFVKNNTWQEVLSMSKASGKMVFIDVYTDWCAPCQRMNKEVFVLSPVGDKFNVHFINYQVNAEKGEGIALKDRYRVISYPTYLFVNGNGTLIYKVQGAMSPDRLMAAADSAFARAREKLSIAQLDSLYAFHRTDKVFLYTYIRRRTMLGLENADLLDRYFVLLNRKEQRMLKNLQLVVDNGSFLHKSLQIGPAFKALMENKDQFPLLHTNSYNGDIAAIKNGAIEKTLRVAIADKNEDLLQEVLELNNKTGLFDNDTVLRLRYFWGTKQYETYEKLAIFYVDSRLMQVSDRTLEKMDKRTFDQVLPSVDSSLAKQADLNEQQKAKMRYTYKRTQTIQFTNTVFDFCRNIIRITENTAILKHVLTWMDRCISLSENDMLYFENVYPIYLDTYACYLYALGDTDHAIEKEQKAIDWIKERIKGNVPEQYVVQLSRMRNNEKLHFHE